MSGARLRAGCHALLVTVAGATVWVLLGLVAWSVLPLALGWRSDVVLSGSMRPAIHEGDVVVSAPAGRSPVRPGQVVVVRRTDAPVPVLHRVSRLTADGHVVTRGDANASEDTEAATAAQLQGVARLRVPYVGLPALWLQQGRVLPVLATVSVLVLACALLSTALPAGFRGRRLSRGGLRAWSRPGGRTSTVVLAAGVAGALAGGDAVAGAVPGQVAAAFTVRTVNAGSTWSAQTAFDGYSATVAQDGPVLYHRFDEGPGTTTAADSKPSGTPRPGTYGATTGTYPTITTTGATTNDVGRAVTFTATTYATGDAVATVGEAVTVEAWVRTTSRGALVGLSTGGDRASPQLYINQDGRLCGGVAPASGSGFTSTCLGSDGTVNNGTWRHVVLTAQLQADDTVTVTLYVDGTVRTAAQLTMVNYQGATVLPQRTGARWRLGTNSLAGWPYIFDQTGEFSGALDEVAVYDRVLAPSRISAHYAARTSTGYADLVRGDTPVRYWRMDDDLPTMADALTTGGEQGTYHGHTEPQVAAGRTGAVSSAASPSTAIRLDGTTGVYSAASATAPRPFTAELWFRTTSTTGGVLVNHGDVQTGSSTTRDRAIYLSPAGRLHLVVAPGGVVSSVSSPAAGLNDGGWHHVVGSVGAAGLRLYVDGVLVASDPTVVDAQVATGYWRWGGDAVSGWPDPPSTSYLEGSIDEAAVYATQLSDVRVAVRYASRSR